MKTPHLMPAGAALLILIALLVIGTAYAQGREQRYIAALAAQPGTINYKGSALQKIGFQQPDLLMIYGSSEISNQVKGYEASDVFRHYPTGFAPFDVARGGANSLIMAEELAAIGADLRGKKVVISFTPSVFLAPEISPDEYEAMFSRLQVNELAFSTQLDLTVKQAAAQRILQYPQALEKDPLLNFSLQTLAEGSPLDRVMYYVVWPLGKLQTTIIELQDHWETLSYLALHPNLQPDVPQHPKTLDWSAMEASARNLQASETISNPFGLKDSVWQNQFHGSFTSKADGSDDRNYLNSLHHSREWTDLDILLRVLTQLGAQPLLLSRPINGPIWQAMGVSAAARRVYYDTLESVAAKYGVPIVDFRDHDTDKYFSIDTSSHTSRLGWVYVDQTLDEFFHGTLRQAVGQNSSLNAVLSSDSDRTDPALR